MRRAELLKQELQIQQARIAQENQMRAERLESAYEAVSDLNFLGFSPKDLCKQIPESFLRGAYAHYRLPAVELPSAHDTSKPPVLNVGRSANSSPLIASAPVPMETSHATKKPTIQKREQRKRKRLEKELHRSGPMWDSEWVAPQPPAEPKRIRFGDDNWSSKLILNFEESDSESEDDDKAVTMEEIEVAESKIKASVDQLHVEVKGQENHISQLEERLIKQRKAISEKQELLRSTLDKYRDAVGEQSDLPTNPLKLRKSNTVDQILTAEQAEATIGGFNSQAFGKLITSSSRTNAAKQAAESPEKDIASLAEANEFTNAYKLESPLASFNSYRVSSLFIGNNPSRAYSRTYNSLFVKEGELCETELAGEKCQDGQCEFVHFSDYNIPQQQVLTHILKTYVDTTKKKQFAKHLRTLDNPNSEDMIILLLSLLNQAAEE